MTVVGAIAWSTFNHTETTGVWLAVAKELD